MRGRVCCIALLLWTAAFVTPTASTKAQAISVHLTLGNPTGAIPDSAQPLNFLIDRPQYSLSYNRDKGTANWVSWHLASTDLGSAPRSTNFTTDTTLPAGWYRVKTSDYTNSGYDRGHMCPSADRTATVADNQATFIMTNVIAQAPDNNQGPWADLEDYSRSLIALGDELYIISGGDGISTTIAGGKVTVPVDTWKVIVVLPDGDNDVSRITTATRVIAVRMPNTNGIRSTPWQDFEVTTDSIEATTGYDFLTNVPPPVQSVIESRVDSTSAAKSITATAGMSQLGYVLTDFSTPMQAIVLDGANNPVSGISVTIAVLGLTASGTFAGGSSQITVTTDASGVATAPVFTANATMGSYVVEASTAGVYTPAGFTLTNLAADMTLRLYLPLVAR